MSRVFVIAEAGVNHNGDPARAADMIAAAAAAGADAIKFQTFTPERLAAASAPKAEYQKATTAPEESQVEMLRRLSLARGDFRDLAAEARGRGLVFMSTAFDAESLEFLISELDVTPLKIASGEITNAPFLRQHTLSGRPLLLSTGMASLGEIEFALGIIAHACLHPATPPRRREEVVEAWSTSEGRAAVAGRVTLLHCVSAYPAPDASLDLRSIDTLRATFGLPVGYSDHSEGITAAIAAVALGAPVIEKHFTLDRSLPGPDHAASLEPGELTEMIRAIRRLELALGDGAKRIEAAERINRPIGRRSLVAAQPICRGEPFTADNLTTKRPGGGRDPFDYWRLLGTPAPRDYAADEFID
ncbi:MAG: N-acetylneuraminate synthase [Alphaproteobacteria bacterium]|nr:MAG: N-acetylneuraminate synthase [Alphaproteobacteria bacterium]